MCWLTFENLICEWLSPNWLVGVSKRWIIHQTHLCSIEHIENNDSIYDICPYKMTFNHHFFYVSFETSLQIVNSFYKIISWIEFYGFLKKKNSESTSLMDFKGKIALFETAYFLANMVFEWNCIHIM